MDVANPLSRFKPGSLAEIFAVTLPLILASLSMNMMLFIDRVLLSHYSIKAMNTATIASIVVSVFNVGMVAIVGITRVYVSQHSGRNERDQMAKPVWQMIWFSLLTTVMMIPIARYTSCMVLPEPYLSAGRYYYQLLCCCVPVVGCVGALTAYFVGQGRVVFVLCLAVIMNVVNILLDCVFIFGFAGMPAFGVTGAGVATCLTQILQCVILFYAFFRQQSQLSTDTVCPLDYRLCLSMLAVGVPYALAEMLDMSAWAFLTRLMATVSELHLLVMTIGTSIYILFASFADGYYEGITAVAANYIGQCNRRVMRRLMRVAIVGILMIMSIGILPILIFPNAMVHLFVAHETLGVIGRLVHHLRLMLFGVMALILIESVQWVVVGFLEAFSDTVFTMFVVGVGAWVFGVVPIYYVESQHVLGAVWIWMLVAGYAALGCVAMYFRYHKKISQFFASLHPARGLPSHVVGQTDNF